MDRVRLDLLLVEKGLFTSRSRAQGAILAGLIVVDGERVDKAGTPVLRDAVIEYRGEAMPYVSRGGLKLKKALTTFAIDPSNLLVLDIGASTGGFTHCLLKEGAKRVYAVDVGYNQLDYSLRTHERVVVMERVNARYLKPSDFPSLFSLVTVDVSFISLTLILPPLVDLLEKGGAIIALVKPQFEVGRERVGKRGVVRDRELHQEILLHIVDFTRQLGLSPTGVMASPIKGKKEKNVEYFLYIRSLDKQVEMRREIERVVKEAYRE